MAQDPEYSTIRDPDLLGPAIGCRIVDVTQHDEEEFDETQESVVYLHLDNGMVIVFSVGDKFLVLNHPNAEGSDG